MTTTNVCVTDGDHILFTIDVFKYKHPNAVRIDAIDLNDDYQFGIKYGQVLKDLGRCVFMQIIKANIIDKGHVRRSKVVGKIA